MTPRIVRILGVFIHRVDFRLVGMKLQLGHSVDVNTRFCQMLC